MTEKALAPVAKKRAELFQAMPGPLQHVATEFEKKIVVVTQGVVRLRWDMGARLNQVADQPSKYGKDAIAQLAAYTGITGGKQTLFNWRNLAKCFDRETISTQAAIPAVNGKLLTTEHFLVVTRVPADKDRLAFLAQAREKCWTANDLWLEVKSKYPDATVTKEAKGKGGRSPGVPPSPLAGLRKGYGQAQKLTNYLATMDDNVFTPMLELPATEINQNALDGVTNFKLQLVETRDALNEALADVEQVEKRVQKVLAQQEAKAESSDDAADEQDDGADSMPAGAVPKKRGRKKTKTAVAD